MTSYVALLRGINVSRHNRILMVDLKNALMSLGLQRIETYIQSGNVIFESDLSPDELCKEISMTLQANFNIQTGVLVRSKEEFQALMDACPYTGAVLSDNESIHVTLFNEPVNDKLRNDLLDVMESDTVGDKCTVNGREIYFLLRQSILDSKVVRVAQKSKATWTSRNWATMLKLKEMLLRY